MAEIIETKEFEKQETLDELTETLEHMRQDQNSKITTAIGHFTDYMYSIAAKYLTANGVMAAIDVIKQLEGGNGKATRVFKLAKLIAIEVSSTIAAMINEAEHSNFWSDGKLSEEFESFLDKWYDPNFARNDDVGYEDLVYQLLMLQCCQMFSSSIDDIVNFYKGTNDEIEKMEARIEELKASE